MQPPGPSHTTPPLTEQPPGSPVPSQPLQEPLQANDDAPATTAAGPNVPETQETEADVLLPQIPLVEDTWIDLSPDECLGDRIRRRKLQRKKTLRRKHRLTHGGRDERATLQIGTHPGVLTPWGLRI